MKMKLKNKIVWLLLILSVFSLITCSNPENEFDYGSYVIKDSLIFSDSSSIPEYPYSIEYENYLRNKKVRTDSLISMMARDSNLIVDELRQLAIIYVVENEIDSMSIEDYLQKVMPDESFDCSIIFSFKVEWNGRVSEVRINRTKGDVPKNIDYDELCKKLVVTPEKVDNVPIPGPNMYFTPVHLYEN